jgi:hypothetical protein
MRVATYTDGVLVSIEGEVSPPPVPEAVSTMQLARALFRAEKISATEAEAFGGAGVIPPTIRAGIIVAMQNAGFNQGEISDALITFIAARDYRRHHPITPVVGMAIGLDSAGLDDLFRLAATLD